ncbi:hypothetical protein ACLOJK_026625, partial [Asimina triloba]
WVFLGWGWATERGFWGPLTWRRLGGPDAIGTVRKGMYRKVLWKRSKPGDLMASFKAPKIRPRLRFQMVGLSELSCRRKGHLQPGVQNIRVPHLLPLHPTKKSHFRKQIRLMAGWFTPVFLWGPTLLMEQIFCHGNNCVVTRVVVHRISSSKSNPDVYLTPWSSGAPYRAAMDAIELGAMFMIRRCIAAQEA